ncbi:hypothetical protein Tco_1465447 [Tanacetum coccineum]
MVDQRRRKKKVEMTHPCTSFSSLSLLMSDATGLTFSINSNIRNDVIKKRRVGLIWTIRREPYANISSEHLSSKDVSILRKYVKKLANLQEK